MCSIIPDKINKYLTNIVREYLLINKETVIKNYSNIHLPEYEGKLPYFLERCYLLQLKRTFPQPHYHLKNNYIKFYIPNLQTLIENHYIFTKNEYIYYYIDISGSNLYFSIYPEN